MRATTTPNDVARGGGVELGRCLQPRVKEFVFLLVRRQAEGFEIPTVFAIVRVGQIRPQRGGFRTLVMPQSNEAFAADNRAIIVGLISDRN